MHLDWKEYTINVTVKVQSFGANSLEKRGRCETDSQIRKHTSSVKHTGITLCDDSK